MTFFRNLWSDLVEKRLWPVVLLLVVALVAAPIAIGRGAHAPVERQASAAPAPGTPAAGPDATKVIALATPEAPHAKLRGRPHNPFRDPTARPPKPAPAAGAAAATPGAVATPVAPPGGGVPPAGGATPIGGATPGAPATPVGSETPATPVGPSTPVGGNTPGTPVGPTTPAGGETPATAVDPATPIGHPGDPTPGRPATPGRPGDVPPVGPTAPVSPQVYRVALSFGRAGHRTTTHDVARLTPLPSATNPSFVFLGVLDDGRTALFLVSSVAKASGDGTCLPNPASCQTIELRAGDSERFDIATSRGTVQYQLDLLKVEQRQVTSQAVAARAHRRESRAGRNLLRVAMDQRQPALQGLAYDLRKGTLRADPAAALRAASAASGHRFPPLLPAG